MTNPQRLAAVGSLVALVGLAACSTGGTWTAAAAPAPKAQPAPSALTQSITAPTPEAAAAIASPVSTPAPSPALSPVMLTSANANLESPAAIENVSRITFATEGADFDPAVSQDGGTLVFASTQHRTKSDIYLKQVSSRVVTRLTNDPGDDVQPAISPDGTRIAFASNRNGNWDIFVMPAKGGQAVQWTDEAADDLHPSWSPDGKQIVFSRFGQVSGRWELWTAGTGTKNTAPAFIGYGMFPEWCPLAGAGDEGSERILFQMGRERGSRTFGVWTLDYKDGQTTNLTEIASSSDTALINPTWSPDGRFIVYTEVPAQSSSNSSVAKSARPQSADLFLAATDGSSRIRLTSGPAISMFPRWSGKHSLFFVSDRGGRDNIWSMDLGNALMAMGENSPPHSLNAAATITHVEPQPLPVSPNTEITIHDSKVAGADEPTDAPVEPSEEHPK